jgi:hypothetical protein
MELFLFCNSLNSIDCQCPFASGRQRQVGRYHIQIILLKCHITIVNAPRRDCGGDVRAIWRALPGRRWERKPEERWSALAEGRLAEHAVQVVEGFRGSEFGKSSEEQGRDPRQAPQSEPKHGTVKPFPRIPYVFDGR